MVGRSMALASFFAVTALSTISAAPSPSFVIENDSFMRDGQPFQIMAGCIHYSRVPSEYWEDRLTRLKAMGLNSIQTYVPWNWHVATRGVVDFSGDRNLTQFVLTAQRVGLLVVLRAGPYMCGEWEYGGLPAWIAENGTIKLRTYAEPYMSYVKEYWTSQLLPVVKPLLYSNGGPVVMVQVENEYGSYGDVSTNPNDLKYMQTLIEFARAVLGDAIILFTTDGGDTGYMSRGTIKGDSVYSVGDGCGNIQTCIDAQREFNAPDQSPFMCSECYTGWLTHWGEGGANTSSSAPHIDSILKVNGSVSLYMGHGGTNWGFWSGANGGGGSSYQPHETSYDYDSPISEAGEHGYHAGVDKYVAMKNTLTKYSKHPVPDEPPLLPRTSYGTLNLTRAGALLDNINTLAPKFGSSGTSTPASMESFGCWYGMALYSTMAHEAVTNASMTFSNLQDRVHAFVNGVYQGTSYRCDEEKIPVTSQAGGTIDLLVENMGRINYGHGMDSETKGTGAVLVDGTGIGNWSSRCLPLNTADIQSLSLPLINQSASAYGPATIFQGVLEIDSQPMDTFLLMDGWTKGVAWVNGFNLGRYWQPEGPQQTLYLPGTKLQKGANHITILELDQVSTSLTVAFVGEPMLQKPPKPPCDPTKQPEAGAHVAMVSKSTQLSHQQMFTMDAQSKGGYAFRLVSNNFLCLTVEHGCPHSSSGCVTVDSCTFNNDQLFDWVVDPTNSTAHRLVLKSTGQCLDIYSHDTNAGAPLEVFSCYAPGEDNQRWSYNSMNSLITSFQPSGVGSEFVVTVCT